MSDCFSPRREVPALRDGPPERLGRLQEARWSGWPRLRATDLTPTLIAEPIRDVEGLADRSTRIVAGTLLLRPGM